MDLSDWLIALFSFFIGALMLSEAVVYLKRGTYTKTFKGVSRREYISRIGKPSAFWFNLSLHTVAGAAMIFFGFWFISLNPAVSSWYTAIRMIFVQ